MPQRIERRPLPDVEIVDMRVPGEGPRTVEFVSPKLKEALEQNLASGHQALVFLNRRGFHRFFMCRSCGQSVRCPNCDVALTHHLSKNSLDCHYCGFHIYVHRSCPSCGRESLRPYGFGTERLEHELQIILPEARIARLDSDNTRKKGETFRILKRFGDHETDILVGTQMITKGHDFPKVTLVGVIAADLSLEFPDFRAGEKTFQILSQVAGRAGRGDQRGRVIVQTFNPDHYAIRAAIAHDYDSFFETERDLRRQLDYPPFSHLACLMLLGNNESKTAQTAQVLSQALRNVLARWPKRGREIKVLGPAEAPFSRLKGKYRWQILIKCKTTALRTHLLNEIEKLSKKNILSKGVRLSVDVDPYQMT